MKILLTDLGDAVDAKGGIEKVVTSMANAMVERGHNVTVMIFDRRDGKMFFPLDERVNFINLGIGVHTSRTWVNISNLFVWDRGRKEYRRYQHLCRAIAKMIKPCLDEISPDVIIAHEYKSLMVLKDILDTNIPVVSFFHFDPQTVLENKYFRPTYKKVDCVNVLLPSYAKLTKSLTEVKQIVSIPNVVPQYDGYCDYEAKVITNVARIDHRQKRQKILVEAFAKLSKDFVDWRLELWGDADFDRSYYEELQQFVNNHGLQEKVCFCGVTSDVSKQLCSASVFAFPSAYEGFGLALTEAMSMGLSVIGFKCCSAVNEIIRDGQNGVLSAEGTDAFAKNLCRLMESVELRKRYGMQAKKDMKKFSANKIWDCWEKILNNLVDGKKVIDCSGGM